MSKTVIVTGGAGYLGSVLVGVLLDRGFQPVVVDIGWRGTDHLAKAYPGVAVVRADVTELASEVGDVTVSNAYGVIHLASVSRQGDKEYGGRMRRHPYETAELIRILRPHQRLVYASTCSVYGHARDDEVCTEATAPDPVCEYGRMKLEAERLVVHAGGTAIRMGTLCGPSPMMRWDLVVNAMVRSAVTDRKISVWGPGDVRPHLDVRDAASIYVDLLEHPRDKIAGMNFNAARDNESMNGLAVTVRRCVTDRLGFDVEIVADSVKSDGRSYAASTDELGLLLPTRRSRPLRQTIDDLITLMKTGSAI